MLTWICPRVFSGLRTTLYFEHIVLLTLKDSELSWLEHAWVLTISYNSLYITIEDLYKLQAESSRPTNKQNVFTIYFNALFYQTTLASRHASYIMWIMFGKHSPHEPLFTLGLEKWKRKGVRAHSLYSLSSLPSLLLKAFDSSKGTVGDINNLFRWHWHVNRSPFKIILVQ